MKSVAGNSAIVTGASAGIGYGIAKRFAQNGTKVLLTGRTEQTLAAAVAAIKTEVPDAELRYQVADATNESDIEEVVSVGEQAFGSINTIVANVGGNVAPAPVLTHDEATWLVALSTTLASWRCS